MKQDDKGRDLGVTGSISLLQNAILSSQPISSLDWNRDKVNYLLHITSRTFYQFYKITSVVGLLLLSLL